MCNYCGLVFLFGSLCGLLFSIFAGSLKAYCERVKRKNEIEDKTLKLLRKVVHDDEKH